MRASDPRADLHRYLQVGRDALLWKLDGLSEYDATITELDLDATGRVPWWTEHRERVEQAARDAAGDAGGTPA